MTDDPNNPPEQDDALQTDDVTALRSEAANRRRQLRSVEAERDEWKTKWNERNRQDVERMATDRFADPSDLWSVTSLEQLQGEDGLIDPEKAGAEFERVLTEKPHWKKPPPVKNPDLHQGARQSTEPEPEGPSFGQTVKKALLRG